MKIFLKLKHWQIFLIWIFGAVQLQIFIRTNYWFISYIIYIALFFGWIFSIGYVLNENKTELRRKLKVWGIISLLSTIPFGINAHQILSDSIERLNGLLVFSSGIIGIISIIKVSIISAKSLKEKEKGKNVQFSEYLLYLFLVLYMIIGLWILQPRLNKIVNEN